MNKELEIWRFAAARLRRGEMVVLLAVAESSGSSPGRAGFKMIVAADESAGSIGGGVMEVALVDAARKEIADSRFQIPDSKSQIANRKSQILDRVHRKNAENASGMICSGEQTVISFRLTPAHLTAARRIVRALKQNLSPRLRLSEERFEVVVDSPASETQKPSVRFARISAEEFVYEEILGLKYRLYIVGGGHCALALSELAARLDFHISLFDDRAELDTIAKNRFAHRKTILSSYEEIAAQIPSGEDVYVVVMTLGYRFDELVIRKLIDRDFKYFGVLGSRAKMKTLLKNLEKEGFDKERLRKIRTPVGLPINSRTPEEIAVSIAAEIIAVKNQS